MKTFLSHCKGYYKELTLGPLFKLLEAVLELFIPLLVSQIIDVGVANRDIHYVIRYGLLMLLFGASGFVMGITCQYYASKAAQGFGRSLRTVMFQHVLALSDKDTAGIGTNSLITRLTNDVNQVQTGVNMAIRLATRAPFLAIGSVIMAIAINWRIGMIFLISTPLIALALYFIMKKSIPFYRNIQRRQDNISGFAKENLEGVRVIRAFSRQDAEIEGFTRAGDDLADVTIFVGKISAVLNPLTYTIVNLTVIVILWMGADFAFHGNIESGQIIALVNYMNSTLLAMIVLANLIVLFTRAVASWGRINEVLQLTPSIWDGTFRSPAAAADAVENGIVFENVSFAYHKESAPALDNINFVILPETTVGIIGGTGSGKSTLAKLIMRFYDTTSGTVIIDGTAVTNYALDELHDKIGFVPQTASLFNGTIRQNLLLGKPDATDEDMWQALELAQGREFVENMPHRLDTQIREGGKNLSGGQKQRLTIARAIIKKPKFLIFDDSSSALDYATDTALRHSLATQIHDTTVLIISQRAASIMNSDQILVLDEGLLVGIGTHNELLKTCEVYQEICISQKVTGVNQVG